MRLFCIADVHLDNHRQLGGAMVGGLNDRCRWGLTSLELAYRMAVEDQCDAVLISGDFFNTVAPNPQLISAAQGIIRKVPTYLLKGNHDSASSLIGDHALAPLSPVCTVADEPMSVHLGTAQLLLIPFQTGPAVGWLPAAIRAADKKDRGKVRIASTHVGVADDRTERFMKGADDSIEVSVLFSLMRKYDIDTFVLGNWHHHKVWTQDDRTIIQVGALSPTGWGNPGLGPNGCAVVTDGHRVKRVEVPGVRFFDVEDPQLDIHLEVARDQGSRSFLRVRATSERLAELSPYLEALEEDGLVSKIVVRPIIDTKKLTSKAVRSVESADSIDAAICRFVDRAPVVDYTFAGRVVRPDGKRVVELACGFCRGV